MLNSGEVSFQVTLSRAVLLDLLERTGVVIPSKDAAPSLLNFSLTVEEASLSVAATDQNTSFISCSADVTVGAAGSCLLPARSLLDIVRSAEAGNISISVSGRVAELRAGSALWSIQLPNQEDFPQLPDMGTVKLSEIPRLSLFEAFARVRFAAASESLRPSFVLVDVSGGVFTATDGMRWQQVQTGFDIDMQLPVMVVADILKLLKASSDDGVWVGSSEHYFVFAFGSDVLMVQRPSSSFPSVEQIFQEAVLSNTAKFSLDKQTLLDSIGRVRLTADNETEEVALRLTSSSAVLSSVDRVGNRAEVEMPCSWSDASRTLHVSHRFLYEAAKYFPGTECSFYLGADTPSKKSMVLLKTDDSRYISVMSQIVSYRR